jgi:hypothetical protein
MRQKLDAFVPCCEPNTRHMVSAHFIVVEWIQGMDDSSNVALASKRHRELHGRRLTWAR